MVGNKLVVSVFSTSNYAELEQLGYGVCSAEMIRLFVICSVKLNWLLDATACNFFDTYRGF